MYQISKSALAISFFTVALVGCTPQIALDDNDMNTNDNSVEFTEVEPMIGDAKSINGSAKLPAGSGLDASTLRVDTHASESSVGADGAFDAESFSNVPTLALLVNEDDTAIMLGFIGDEEGPSDIDAKSTATALLYFAIGGWTIPANRLPELLHEISTSDTCAELASVVETAIAANPTALKEGDPTIDAALANAAALLLAPDAENAKTFKRLARTQGATNTFLTLDPGEDRFQSGARIAIAGDTSVNVLNSAARRACLYVVQSAFEDAEGVRTEISPVEQIGSVLEVPASKRVQPGISLDEVLAGTSIDNIVEGNRPAFWTPGQAGPATLEPREDASKTELTLVLIGPSLDESSAPAILSDPDYVLLFDEWEAKLEDLQAETFVMEFMIPLAEAMSIGTNLALFQETTATFSLTQLILPVVEGAGISLDTTAGYTGAVEVVITRALNNLAFRENLIDAIVAAYIEDTGARFSRNRLISQFNRLAELGSVDSAIALGVAGDAGRVLEDLRGSRSASTWIAEFANVKLTPSAATVTPDNRSATFTAEIAFDSSDSFTYEWSLSGGPGELLGFDKNDTSASGSNVTSSDNFIEYFVADAASIFEGELATVNVDVFDGDTFIGSASATVNGAVEDDDEEPLPCESVGFSDKPNAQFVSLSVPDTVVAGDNLTFSITINRGAIQAFSKNPVDISATRVSVSSTEGVDRPENQSQVLLNGSPMVTEPTGNFSRGGIGFLSTDPRVEAAFGLIINTASRWVRFPSDGPSTLTISVPIDDSAQTRCASNGIVSVVSVRISSFLNLTDNPIPTEGLSAFAQFVVLPPETE